MRMIKSLLRLIMLMATLLAAYLAYTVTRPLTLPVQTYEFALNPGTSLKGLAHQMHLANVLPTEWTFVWMGRALGQASQIKAGNYEVTGSISPLGLLNLVTKGQVSQSQILISEGYTFKQLRYILNVIPDIRHDSVGLSETNILQYIGAPGNKAEGLFFPDTYYFAKDSSDLALLKRAYQTMQQHLQENWASRAPGLPLQSPYQALILASIVEKETGQANDRSMVAGVFINRLRMAMPLQTDPTVIYGLGDHFDGNLRKRDLLTDTPYNTYTRGGLPPTPIALPGLAALQASLHPAMTDALYFVARGDGSSQFSSTLAQHNRAVDRYQK